MAVHHDNVAYTEYGRILHLQGHRATICGFINLFRQFCFDWSLTDGIVLDAVTVHRSHSLRGSKNLVDWATLQLHFHHGRVHMSHIVVPVVHPLLLLLATTLPLWTRATYTWAVCWTCRATATFTCRNIRRSFCHSIRAATTQDHEDNRHHESKPFLKLFHNLYI